MPKQFSGFLVATEPGVTIPRTFFTDVLPQLTDAGELHTTLTVFRLIAEAGGLETPISQDTLLSDRPLRQALRVVGSPREPDRRIAAGLDLAVGRATLLRFVATTGPRERVWYYVNTPVNQAMIAAMARGAVPPPVALWQDERAPTVSPERPNVFRLYEQNIGLLTPLIADHLVSALENYPSDWIEDAIGEAVTYNRRSWRYIQRILEKWAAEGRDAGDHPAKERSHEAYRRRRPVDPDSTPPNQRSRHPYER